MSGEILVDRLSGVGKKTVQKWTEKGYGTLKSIANASSQQLVRDLEINVTKAQSYIAEANNILAEETIIFETGQQILELRESIIRHISTGSKRFDRILGGGVQTDASTIFFGPYGTLKTQICQNLCVNSVIDNKQKAFFLSTEQATFVPERFVQMAVLGKGYVPMKYTPKELAEVLTKASAGEFEVSEERAKQYIQNCKGFFKFGKGEKDSDIMVVRSQYLQNPDKLYKALMGIEKDYLESGVKAGIIVVDSFTGVLRREFLGRGRLSERSEEISRHIGIIQRLTSRYNLAFVATGQTYGVPDTYGSGEVLRRTGMNHRPWGGDMLMHCLVGGTKIIMHDWSLKNIEDVKVGDKVVTFNEKTSEKEIEEVRDVRISGISEELVEICDGRHKIFVTPEHEIYTTNRGWIRAKNVKKDDELVIIDKGSLNLARYCILRNRSMKGKSYEEIYGQEKALEIRKELSVLLSGENNPMFGEHPVPWSKGLTKETNESLRKISKARKKWLSNPKNMKLQKERIRGKVGGWNRGKHGVQDYSFMQESRPWEKSPMTGKVHLIMFERYSINKTEKLIDSILQSHFPDEWKFVGDGGVFIGGKVPDWINVNGKKKLIEYSDTYWKESVDGIKFEEYKKERKQHFGQYGFETLVLCEDDLQEDIIVEKVSNFLVNPIAKVSRVKYVKKYREERLLYDITTPRNHNFFANGILVHNSFTFQISLTHAKGGKSQEDEWEVYVFDAPVPRQSARIVVTKEGVRDVVG